MIEQTVLPFTLAAAEDSITAHAGLAVGDEFQEGNASPGAGKVRFLAGERLVGVPRAPGALWKS